MRRIRQNDEVIIISGKDKGKRGKVIRVSSDDRVWIENINIVKRHTKGNPLQNRPGGILDKEMPLHISNVAVFNSSTQKADKVGFKFLEDGKKVRFFRSNGEVIDV
jgi:large subunit ribosomal protein L24